jgi:hypothetical protein
VEQPRATSSSRGSDVLSCYEAAVRFRHAAIVGSLVAVTVRDRLLGGEHVFEDRGEHELKGVTGAWRLYEFAG